ncbi:MAG: Crp/Fnr family transcriptional regulator [Candidimonas sp.]|nr:MAG: Crp/Fnr family transcriptional regulator [Candidimonas sp.]TAM24676.1 MAG: Crp/Fnr family transcriptional regulator [Candidimonas sp.]TAM75184.1 MAG: Crp/Fnr family transcriptional regulator [Candidimonas sp.]
MAVKKIRIQDFLSELTLFNELNDSELDDVAQASVEINVDRGNLAFQRGDPCNGFHIVVCGQVKLALVSPQGNEKVIAILRPGQSFGEALMFMERPYIMSAQALVDTKLLHVPKTAVLAQLALDYRFVQKMLVSLSQRLYELINDIEAYSLKSGSQRVVDYLLQCNQHARTSSCHLECSKAVVASRLNLTPEHFSRILHGLCTNRLIRVNGRAVTIVNIEKLRGYQGRILP